MPLSLNHIGAMLEINVSASEVDFISFLGNEKEVLSPVIVDPKTGKYESPSQPNVQITVPRQNGSTYILVPPFLFKKGFTLILSENIRLDISDFHVNLAQSIILHTKNLALLS